MLQLADEEHLLREMMRRGPETGGLLVNGEESGKMDGGLEGLGARVGSSGGGRVKMKGEGEGEGEDG